MGIETELKFQIPHRLGPLSHLGIPKGAIGRSSRSELVTTYFDTKDHKLERRGLSLRVRENSGSFVQAVKAATAASVGRCEWESDVKGASPDLKKTKDSPLQELNLRKLRRQLTPVFRTSVRRAIIPLTRAAARSKSLSIAGALPPDAGPGRSPNSSLNSNGACRPISFGSQKRSQSVREPNFICRQRLNGAINWYATKREQ
jgi:hypothetical protein